MKPKKPHVDTNGKTMLNLKQVFRLPSSVFRLPSSVFRLP
jgi:hypothetical protein